MDSNFIVSALVWAKIVTQRPKGKRPDSSLAPFGGGRTFNRQGLPEGYWISALERGILGPWPYAVSLPLFPATWRQAASSTTRFHFNTQAPKHEGQPTMDRKLQDCGQDEPLFNSITSVVLLQ